MFSWGSVFYISFDAHILKTALDFGILQKSKSISWLVSYMYGQLLQGLRSEKAWHGSLEMAVHYSISIL